jgi:hypothetical protein
MRYFLILFFLGLAAIPAGAAGSPVLNRAAEKWLAEGNRWAVTMQVREWEDNQLKEERVERYDPSKPGAARWELLSVDGQPPTPERRAAWEKSKARKHRKAPKSLSDYFDFANAKATGGTDGSVSYLVPLRSNHGWLFPVEHVALTLTVNKANYAVEEVKAGIDEPFRMALGLARVVDVNFDVKINPSPEHGAAVGPATSKPNGTAHVVVAYLNKRIEYSWSEFKRVTPAGEADDAAGEE